MGRPLAMWLSSAGQFVGSFGESNNDSKWDTTLCARDRRRQLGSSLLSLSLAAPHFNNSGYYHIVV